MCVCVKSNMIYENYIVLVMYFSKLPRTCDIVSYDWYGILVL